MSRIMVVRQHSQGGFSLLEAIVALVLLSTVGMALFSWINTSLIGLNRAQAVITRTQTIQNALSAMEQINPAEAESGEMQVGNMEIEWYTEIVEPLQDGVGYPLGTGLYQIGLYDTHVTVKQEDKEQVSFVIRQVGFLQVRTIDFSL